MGSDQGSRGRVVSRGTGEPARAGPRRASCVSEQGDRPAEGAVSKSPSPTASGGPLLGTRPWGEAWACWRGPRGPGTVWAGEGTRLLGDPE